jgi:hypothetical protein
VDDVRNGFVGEDIAASVYGVTLDAGTLDVRGFTPERIQQNA